MKARFAWSTLWLMLGSASAQAQADSTVAFLEQARAGSRRYLDPAVALADGYHPVGPEAPAMGQHWINPRLLAATQFDPAQPAILEYASVHGHLELVGVAYALALEPGEAPPDVPAGRAAWHSHQGGIEQESLRLTHEDGPTALPGERVAVLHAWAWIANPAGPFAPNNWDLPYVRAGIQPPATPGADARALSLDSGGVIFWQAALARGISADARETEALHRVLNAYADTVAQWRDRVGPERRLSDGDRAWLGTIWDSVRAALQASVAAPERQRLALLTQP